MLPQARSQLQLCQETETNSIKLKT